MCILLHCKHASTCHSSIMIQSPDTDVAVIVICVGHKPSAHLYFTTGVKNKSWILHSTKLTSPLGPEASKEMNGLHTFTSCDSTGTFYGKGKQKAQSSLTASEHFTAAFIELGNQFSLLDSVITQLKRFLSFV